MAASGASWSTAQLAEFLAAVSGSPDVAAARQNAVERAAEAFGAEVGALVVDGTAPASIGFPRAAVPHAELTAAAAEGGVLEVPGVGDCACLAAPVDGSGVLLVARDPEDPFTREEESLLRAMGRVLSLALTNARNHADAVHRALHDPLTGLGNRVLFRERLEHALERCPRSGKDVAVLFVDVDGFKAVNDRHGHAYGDELLVALAGRLRALLRAEDTAARLGGDEFAVLLEEVADGAAAIQVAERLLDELQRPVEINGDEVTLGASVGIATGGVNADDLLRNADFAMYQAKAGGRGRYALFEPEMHAWALGRLTLEADLRRALARGELFLEYQPIVRVATGEISAVEALVRWRHSERGVVPPNDFIPLAEERGLIVPIGSWVLREACRQGAAWQRRWPHLRVAVNVSGLQLAQAGLAAEIRAALADTGMHPGCLVLELTETVLMQDVDETAARLDEIQRLGIEIAIDDFGTGYSSLQYLLRFPIDSLKVARTFVDGLDEGGDRAVLARAIIDFAASLGLRVVGEGVERTEQLTCLAALGCDFAQGFLLARPMPAAELTALLDAAPAEAA